MTDLIEYAFERDLKAASEFCGDVVDSNTAISFLHGFVSCWVLRTYGEISTENLSRFFKLGSSKLNIN